MVARAPNREPPASSPRLGPQRILRSADCLTAHASSSPAPDTLPVAERAGNTSPGGEAGTQSPEQVCAVRYRRPIERGAPTATWALDGHRDPAGAGSSRAFQVEVVAHGDEGGSLVGTTGWW